MDEVIEEAERTMLVTEDLATIAKRAKTALLRYEAAYDRLTDCGGVQALKGLSEKVDAKSPNGIVSKIVHKNLREARRNQRPDLATPLSLKDDFVRRVVQTLGATDYEKVLGEKISDLESELRNAQAPKTLRERMLRLLEDGMDKNTVGSVLVGFFEGIREGRNVCCLKEPGMLLLDSLEDVTNLACIDDGEGAPYLAVLTSPDSPRLANDTTPAVVFPMARLMEGLRKYDVIAGIALDPWDRGGLLLKRDAILKAWERNGKFRQEQNTKD